MGFTANKKILVLGVAYKKDLYLGTEGVVYIELLITMQQATHVHDACSHTCTQANTLTPSDPTHAHTRTSWTTQRTYTRRACTHTRPQNARE